MNSKSTFMTAACLAVLVSASAAWGATLADDPNAMGGQWQTLPSSDPGYNPLTITDTFSFSATLEWAVYEPGDFELSFPGESVDQTHYVYAYQIIDIQELFTGYGTVSSLTIGLTDGDEQATGIDWVLDGTGQTQPPPSSSYFSSDSAVWYWGPPTEDPSPIVYFTSPFEPEWDNMSLSAGLSGGGGSMPSPTPEPASMSLLGLGLAALGMRKRRNQRT